MYIVMFHPQDDSLIVSGGDDGVVKLVNVDTGVMCTHTYIHAYICVCMCIIMFLFVHTYIYTCIYMCMYVYSDVPPTG